MPVKVLRGRTVQVNDDGAEEADETKLLLETSARQRRSPAAVSLVTLLVLGIVIVPQLVSFPAMGQPKPSPVVDPTEFELKPPQELTVHGQSVGPSIYELTALQERQIQNYRKGRGLMLNFHITHHGGTTACSWARKNGPVPNFACMAGENVPAQLTHFSDVNEIPWSSNQTDFYVNELRKHFHFVSWEFNWQTLQSSLNDTNWEHPNLLSIIIMRNPMTRLMSSVGRYFVKNDTAEEWWDYASNSLQTDNYALRSLTSYEGCCRGEKTSSKYVAMAKSYLKRFTFIIDLECLEESLIRLCEILNLTMTADTHINTHSKSKTGHYDLRDRLQNDTLYTHLVKRNAKDIELYRWAKMQSLVQCRHSDPIVDLDGLSIGI